MSQMQTELSINCCYNGTLLDATESIDVAFQSETIIVYRAIRDSQRFQKGACWMFPWGNVITELENGLEIARLEMNGEYGTLEGVRLEPWCNYASWLGWQLCESTQVVMSHRVANTHPIERVHIGEIWINSVDCTNVNFLVLISP
jgi:hypothetical protein